MKPLERFADIHSHRKELAERGDTVVAIAPEDEMLPRGTYSVGIHPWETTAPVSLGRLKQLVKTARDPRVVAIGECGFDRLRGGSLEAQSRLFDFHAKLAARLGKPLIIHAVRSDDLVLEAAKRLHPRQGDWIIHGFRGKPQAAAQFLRAGLSLSYGERFTEEAFNITPPLRRYRETDAM